MNQHKGKHGKVENVVAPYSKKQQKSCREAIQALQTVHGKKALSEQF